MKNAFTVVENEQTAATGLFREKQKRLRAIGGVILLLGLATAAAIYWIGMHSTGPSEEELLPGYARMESHQMQFLYGKMGLLMQELSNNLKQPGTQAGIVAAISILAAVGCFYFARLLNDGSKPLDERASPE